MTLFQRGAAIANKAVLPLLRLPGIGSLLSGSFATLTYQGRKSTKTFTLPVNYRRQGDKLVVPVMLPDQKRWWRNFSDGGPITVAIGNREQTGHAVSQRDDKGQVSVHITLDEA